MDPSLERPTVKGPPALSEFEALMLEGRTNDPLRLRELTEKLAPSKRLLCLKSFKSKRLFIKFPKGELRAHLHCAECLKKKNIAALDLVSVEPTSVRVDLTIFARGYLGFIRQITPYRAEVLELNSIEEELKERVSELMLKKLFDLITSDDWKTRVWADLEDMCLVLRSPYLERLGHLLMRAEWALSNQKKGRHSFWKIWKDFLAEGKGEFFVEEVDLWKQEPPAAQRDHGQNGCEAYLENPETWQSELARYFLNEFELDSLGAPTPRRQPRNYPRRNIEFLRFQKSKMVWAKTARGTASTIRPKHFAILAQLLPPVKTVRLLGRENLQGLSGEPFFEKICGKTQTLTFLFVGTRSYALFLKSSWDSRYWPQHSDAFLISLDDSRVHEIDLAWLTSEILEVRKRWDQESVLDLVYSSLKRHPLGHPQIFKKMSD